MDTRQLKVGQPIRVNVRLSFYQGKVINLTPDSVEVQPDDVGIHGPPLRFDSNGVGYLNVHGRVEGQQPPSNVKVELAPIPDFVGTLKVGQTVNLKAGIEGCKAKVLEITTTGVIGQRTDDSSYKIRFDINGRAVDSCDLGWDQTRIYNSAPGTFEGGPWYIE